MREQAIQTAITKYLDKRGAYWVKIVSASKSGVPDILACVAGRLVGLEVKTATGRPSELQLYNIEKIQKAGGIAGVVRSVEDVRVLLDNLGSHVRIDLS